MDKWTGKGGLFYTMAKQSKHNDEKSSYQIIRNAKNVIQDNQTSPIQMELFSNIPMAKGVMNRAMTEVENYLIAEIRYRIQERLETDSSIDITRPMSFSFSINELGKERGTKNLTMFRKTITEVVESMKKNVPSISVEYTDSNNQRHVGAMPFFDYIDINTDTGDVYIESGVRYQRYYAMYIMNLPELRINKSFYILMKSKYSMPLSDYIIGLIGEERNKGHLDSEYEFIIDINTLMEQVKPNTNLTVKDYFKRVLEPAIKDINNNMYSPFTFLIDNVQDMKVKRGRSVIAAKFNIQLVVTIEHPVFIPYPKIGLIDSEGNPSWEYIETWLKIGLKVNDSYLAKVKQMSLSRVWKALVYTLIHAHSPRYFNKICETMNMADMDIKALCKQLKETHPEYVDDVIESIINLNNN